MKLNTKTLGTNNYKIKRTYFLQKYLKTINIKCLKNTTKIVDVWLFKINQNVINVYLIENT